MADLSTLFVSNFPKDTHLDQLVNFFEEQNWSVVKIAILANKPTDVAGCALVTFASAVDASNVLLASERQFHGRTLKLKRARFNQGQQPVEQTSEIPSIIQCPNCSSCLHLRAKLEWQFVSLKNTRLITEEDDHLPKKSRKVGP